MTRKVGGKSSPDQRSSESSPEVTDSKSVKMESTQKPPASSSKTPIDPFTAISNQISNFSAQMASNFNKLEATFMNRFVQNEERLETLEMEIKKKNLIIWGIDDDLNETPDILEKKLVQFLRHSLKISECGDIIDDCFRLGKFRTDATKSRGVMLKLTKEKHRRTIFTNIKNLKNKDIKIESDLTPLARKKKSILLKKRREAINEGKVVRMTDNILKIDGVVYVVDSNLNVVRKDEISANKNHT